MWSVEPVRFVSTSRRAAHRSVQGGNGTFIQADSFLLADRSRAGSRAAQFNRGGQKSLERRIALFGQLYDR